METLVDEVCGYIKNWFLVKPGGIHRGTFTVENGEISADFLQTNQYFRVKGSVFNDGVWIYQSGGMVDETFTGEIWAMSVPPAFIALISEIQEWQAKYGGANAINMSPFTSESFNNYSYSKSMGGRNSSGSGSSAPMSWQDVYSSRLIRWRKI